MVGTPAGGRAGLIRRLESGFSVLEIVIVVALVTIVSAIAIPQFIGLMRSLRLSGDARNVAEVIGLAKMRAAADFTDARAYFDLAARTYHVDVWDQTQNCWRPDSTALTGNQACLQNGSLGSAQGLSQNITFGFGNVGAPPPNVTGGIAQAPACYVGASGQPVASANPWHGSQIANTACVVFNSRGIPVDSTISRPVTYYAVYVTDGSSMVYGLTISQTGLIRTWSTSISAANWLQR